MPETIVTPEAPELVIGAVGVAAIVQNVRIIISTPKGSVPLDRDFGVSWQAVDAPTPQAKAGLIAEIFRQVEKYEPRARVTGIEWRQSSTEEMDGRLMPCVMLEILE